MSPRGIIKERILQFIRCYTGGTSFPTESVDSSQGDDNKLTSHISHDLGVELQMNPSDLLGVIRC